MTNKIETSRDLIDGVPREWLENYAGLLTEHFALAEAKKVRALLAAPAVERQEPIYQVMYRGDGGGGWCDVDKESYDMKVPHPKHWKVRIVYTSPPAPVSLVLPTRETMRDLIAESIGGDAYDCIRVWDAWAVGTMSADDFIPLVDQDELLYEIADACLNKVKELNA